MTSGIYVIHNTKTGQIYLGKTQNIQSRWQYHRYALNGLRHDNGRLQKAWMKYGEQAFKFKVLEYCPVENLIERERHYLSIYIPKGICYNVKTR